MSDIKFVTTFHQPGMVEYGQRFINSFAERVDKAIHLVVYAENCQPTNPDPLQIIIKTPERHKIKPEILDKLILSPKNKTDNTIINIGEDV